MGPSIVNLAIIPAFGRLRQKNYREFKVSLGYVVNAKIAWAIDVLCQTNKTLIVSVWRRVYPKVTYSIPCPSDVKFLFDLRAVDVAQLVKSAFLVMK